MGCHPYRKGGRVQSKKTTPSDQKLVEARTTGRKVLESRALSCI